MQLGQFTIEPASINGLHIHVHRGLGYASRTVCTLDENTGGHIYTVMLSDPAVAHIVYID